MTFRINLVMLRKENVLFDEKTKPFFIRLTQIIHIVLMGSFFHKQVIICTLHLKSRSKLLFSPQNLLWKIQDT